MKRGDVVLCRVPMPSTQLQRFKLRPAVIVSKDSNNVRLDDVIIAVCTSNVSRRREPTQYLIDGAEITVAGIKVPSVVKCETLFTVPKPMMVRVLGHLSDEGLRRVNACLREALDL